MTDISMERAASRGTLAGIAAALLTVAIWTGWIIATRHAVTGHFDAASLALMRYAIPALMFAPWWLRRGLLPRSAGLGTLLMMIVGAGAPFFFVVATGMRFAPAADIGALLPGTMPLFVALFGASLFSEHIAGSRWVGFAVIAAGVGFIAADTVSVGGTAWRGHLLFLAGASLWALYTHAYRRSGLDARHAAGIVGVWSTLAVLPVLAATGSPALQAPAGEIAVQMLFAFLSGVVALTAYSLAVSRLGASAAAAFSALVPALVALAAIPVLGEVPSMLTLAAVVLVGIGVLVGSGILRRRG